MLSSQLMTDKTKKGSHAHFIFSQKGRAKNYIYYIFPNHFFQQRPCHIHSNGWDETTKFLILNCAASLYTIKNCYVHSRITVRIYSMIVLNTPLKVCAFVIMWWKGNLIASIKYSARNNGKTIRFFYNSQERACTQAHTHAHKHTQ